MGVCFQLFTYYCLTLVSDLDSKLSGLAHSLLDVANQPLVLRNKAKTPIIAGTVIEFNRLPGGYANAILQVCGVVIFLAWIIYLGLWYRKRRRRNKEEHQQQIDDAIITAAHPTSHPNTPGNDTSSLRLGERLLVDPLDPEHTSEAGLLEAPKSNSAAYYTNGAGANQEQAKSAV